MFLFFFLFSYLLPRSYKQHSFFKAQNSSLFFFLSQPLSLSNSKVPHFFLLAPLFIQVEKLLEPPLGGGLISPLG
jgi:hypothetical protein